MKRFLVMVMLVAASFFLFSQPTRSGANPKGNDENAAEDLADVIVGTWNWSCCKEGVYSGQIVIDRYDREKNEFVGNFGGAGGGSIVGHINGQHIHLRRTSSACSSDGEYQDWTGTYNPDNLTITGSIAGCNVQADPNIKASNSFTMTLTVKTQ